MCFGFYIWVHCFQPQIGREEQLRLARQRMAIDAYQVCDSRHIESISDNVCIQLICRLYDSMELLGETKDGIIEMSIWIDTCQSQGQTNGPTSLVII